MTFTVMIPARYGSTRLPGKPLIKIHGKPLLQHVYEAATASTARLVLIATEAEQVRQAAEQFGAQVIMTSARHLSGTDRIAEAASIYGLSDEEIIVNVQGDEYGLPPILIDQLALGLRDKTQAPIATLCEDCTSEQAIVDKNTVKVVIDQHNHALYFSRSPIPCWQQGAVSMPYRRHIGLYAYTVASLQAFSSLPPSALEQSESLEQLRALSHGWQIYIETALAHAGTSIDTPMDLERL